MVRLVKSVISIVERRCEMTVFGKKGKAHSLHSSRVVKDERRLKERGMICPTCDKVMYQEDRDEGSCFIFIEYKCTCGYCTEAIINK